MNRIDAIKHLKAHAREVRAMGATSLYLYGSTARDEAAAGSDLDLYIDYDPTTRFNASDLVGIKQFLEDRIQSTVDITTRDSLHPRLRSVIERQAVKVL